MTTILNDSMTNLHNNSLLLKTQIFKLFTQHPDVFVKKYFKLFTHNDYHFCIYVSFMSNEGIWFSTCMKSISTKHATNVIQHKVDSKSSNAVIDKIVSVLKDDIIANSVDFCCERVPAPKKYAKREINNDVVIKRREKITSTSPQEVQQESHLRKTTTSQQRNEAKLERLMFKDAKMWKWQI